MRFPSIFTGFIFLLLTLPAWAQTAQDDYKAGLQYYLQKQYAQAIPSLKEAVRLNPQFWQAYQMLGSAYYYSGDKASAIDAIQTSLQLHPDNPALQKFASQLGPAPVLPSPTPAPAVVSAAAPAAVQAVPLASTGMSVKPVVDAGSKSQHIFFNILGSFEAPFDGGLGSVEKAYQSQPAAPSGTNVSHYYTPEIFGFGAELGYELDRENALSLSAFGTVASSGPYFETDYYNETTSQYASLGLWGVVSEVDLRYYRYLPEGPDDRWFGFVGAGYETLDMTYYAEQYAGAYPNRSGSSMNAEDMTGGTVGGSIGVGRQFLFFHFLNFEASVAFKYAKVPQVTGTYTSDVTTSSVTSPGPSGQGTLVTLSNGSVVLVDQKYVGSATVTSFDLTGVEGRAAINIWF